MVKLPFCKRLNASATWPVRLAHSFPFQILITTMTDISAQALPLLDDELDLLASLAPLPGAQLIELGCGSARLAADLVGRFSGAHVTGLEVDQRQMAKNLAAPATPGLDFVNAGAQAIPFADACFDGALMLKSLHHVPMALMAQALGEVARVLKPGGWLYVSEPVYDGPLNDIMRLFNDEGVVRAAAQQALDAALQTGQWQAADERRFAMPVHFVDFETFEQRMMRPTYADHQIDDKLHAAIRQRFEWHLGPQGVSLTRPMHVRLLRKVP
jgi:ubiquinone/menaquinone biosynthesis C-methylase UbiE